MPSPHIEHAVAGVVVVNAGLLVAGLVVDGQERLFETVHDVIVAFFVLELLARLVANGWRFFARPFNAFDAAVILGGWCFAWQTIFHHQRSRFPGE